MQRYHFEKIFSQMEKEYGKIKKGDEDAYAMLLFSLEGNALKTYRRNLKSNSLRLREAIALTLFDIKERCNNQRYDISSFRDEDNGRLEKALLMAFDPYTNPEIAEILGTSFTEEQLKDYYSEPVKCLLRIKDSIDLWGKRGGSNGYFQFLEGFMGSEIKGNEMKYTIMGSKKFL